MGHKIVLNLPEEVFEPLVKSADRTGLTPEEIAIHLLLSAARRSSEDPVEKFIGSLRNTAPDSGILINQISDLDAAKLLLDEWKFRQQHCWASLRQYGLAAVTISIVPYLKIDIFAQLGHDLLVFPFVGWCLAIAAVWLFAAEYVRFHPVAKAYQKLLFPHYPEKESFEKWGLGFLNRFIKHWKIGWTTALVFFFGFTILSGANAWFLLRLVDAMARAKETAAHTIG